MADTWTPISGYTPQDYTDTMVFEMSSETKKVETIMGQALVAGEENSQYIKFVLDRYWDGIDISGKTFSIEYALAGKYYGTSNAVNAEMSEDKVRFGWIVPVTACCVSGTLFFVIKVESEDYVLKSQIVEVPVYKTIDVGDVVPEPTKEQWYREFASRVETAITEAETALSTAQAAQASAEAAAQNAQTSENNAEAAAAEAQIRYGSPLTASEAAMMVEENRVYVYTGSESGYTFGNWYYYDGSAWVSGGAYNGSGVNTDTTLTQSGMPADAKATGDEISQIKEDFNDMVNSAYVTDFASGAVAHFTDGADNVPLKSLKVAIEPVQSGSGDPSPSNVRAISGWSSVKVTRAGKNVFPSKGLTQTLNGITIHSNDDSSFTVNGTATANAQFDLTLNNELKLQSGQYTVGMFADKAVTFDNRHVWWFFYNMDAHADIVNCQTPSKTFTLNAVTATRFYLRIISGATVDNVTLYPILVYGSDAPTEFEPYNGNTYNISLASAGTVYGGTLDAVSGEMTVDKKMVTIDSSNYALGVLSGIYNNRYCYRNAYLGGIIEKNLPSETTKACCNILKSISRSDATSASSGIFQYHGDNDELRFLFPLEDAYSTPDKIYALGLECCIPLATPLTYQLTATEIKSLLGINNVWSDAGDVEVEYRADTKLYIKRLTDSDTDMIADTNIVSGQYFMVGNDLYKATVNIASGAQIVVGTNATKVSLSEALNQIKEA